MHIYFIPRGIRHQIEIFEKFMQTQMFPWLRKDIKTGKEFLTMFQGAYRDAGPFKEFVFPEECLADVLAMLGEHEKKIYVSDIKKWGMRKLMGNGIIKIPKNVKYPEGFARVGLMVKENGKSVFRPYRYVEHRGVVLEIIGIKKDRRGTFEGVEQEML